MRVTSATQTSAKDPVVDTAPAQQPNAASVLATASVDVFHGLSMPHAFAASPLAVNSGPTSERLKEWQAWQQSTLGIIDGLGRGLGWALLKPCCYKDPLPAGHTNGLDRCCYADPKFFIRSR